MKLATLKVEPKLLKLDIQFFSENSHPFAEEASAPEPHPYAETPDNSMFAQFADSPNPLLAPDNPALPEQVQSTDQGVDQEAGQAPAEKQYLDFSGRQVEVIDPVINDLHKDYSELNKTFQQANQELQQQRQLNEQYQAMMQQQQATQPQAPQADEPVTGRDISPERMKELDEGYMERMYESKSQADAWWHSQPEVQALERERLGINNVEDMINQRVNEIVGPIQQERELQEQVQNLRTQFADFDTVSPQIQELLSEQPHLADLPNALETMYYMAKGRATHNAPPVQSFEEQLLNPSNQQSIVQNEQIRNMVMQNYQQSKMQQSQQIPTVFGNNAGTQTPMSAGEFKPRTLAEASTAFRRFLGEN